MRILEFTQNYEKLIIISITHLYFFAIGVAGCTKLNTQTEETTDATESENISGDANSGAKREVDGGLKDASNKSVSSVDSSFIVDSNFPIDSNSIDIACVPGQMRCEGNAQALRSVCDSNGQWITGEACPEGFLCDTQGTPSGICKEIVSICEGRESGEAFCDGKYRIVCGPDLVTSETVECESIQHCHKGIGTSCAVCLSGTFVCDGDLLRKCKQDYTGWEDYLLCDQEGEPCNQEAGACTDDACLP